MTAGDTDEERARWLHECDSTHQMWGQDDAAIAAYINGLKLLVLIDLIGRIPHNHHAVLGYRPAPIQVLAIYAATTASPFIDYFVTDRVASSPELSHLFTESLIVMPISHFVNNQRALAPVPLNSRHSRRSVAAAAFNAFYKMDPERARVWWRVLNAVSNSSIMFVKYLYWKTAQSSIVSHAEEHNISRSRIEFVDKLPSFHLHLQVYFVYMHAVVVFIFMPSTEIRSFFLQICLPTAAACERVRRIPGLRQVSVVSIKTFLFLLSAAAGTTR